MSLFSLLLLAFCGLAVAVHLGTTLVVALRCRPASSDTRLECPPVTIVRPVCGLDDMERLTLASTFRLAAQSTELLFCAKSARDPAVSFIEQLIADHPGANARILVGDDLGTDNPKLNNVAKGWRAASHDWVILSDSNQLLPPDYVSRAFQAWREDTGIVCAPPIGSVPGNFWAEVECGFLNTHAARWQYAVDCAGFGFAQGKTMLWRRADLDRWGGIAALDAELAEDAAATKLVRAAGLRVRLAGPSFEQPLGRRTAMQVIARQVRWAQLRRLSFPVYFVPEIFTGLLPPLLAACTAAASSGFAAVPFAVGVCMIWLGAEALLCWRAGWHLSWRSPLAWLLRDLLLPLVWTKAWLVRGYEWRGNAIQVRPVAASA